MMSMQPKGGRDGMDEREGAHGPLRLALTPRAAPHSVTRVESAARQHHEPLAGVVRR